MGRLGEFKTHNFSQSSIIEYGKTTPASFQSRTLFEDKNGVMRLVQGVKNLRAPTF